MLKKNMSLREFVQADPKDIVTINLHEESDDEDDDDKAVNMQAQGRVLLQQQQSKNMTIDGMGTAAAAHTVTTPAAVNTGVMEQFWNRSIFDDANDTTVRALGWFVDTIIDQMAQEHKLVPVDTQNNDDNTDEANQNKKISVDISIVGGMHYLRKTLDRHVAEELEGVDAYYQNATSQKLSLSMLLNDKMVAMKQRSVELQKMIQESQRKTIGFDDPKQVELWNMLVPWHTRWQEYVQQSRALIEEECKCEEEVLKWRIRDCQLYLQALRNLMDLFSASITDDINEVKKIYDEKRLQIENEQKGSEELQDILVNKWRRLYFDVEASWSQNQNQTLLSQTDVDMLLLQAHAALFTNSQPIKQIPSSVIKSVQTLIAKINDPSIKQRFDDLNAETIRYIESSNALERNKLIPLAIIDEEVQTYIASMHKSTGPVMQKVIQELQKMIFDRNAKASNTLSRMQRTTSGMIDSLASVEACQQVERKNKSLAEMRQLLISKLYDFSRKYGGNLSEISDTSNVIAWLDKSREASQLLVHQKLADIIRIEGNKLYQDMQQWVRQMLDRVFGQREAEHILSTQ